MPWSASPKLGSGIVEQSWITAGLGINYPNGGRARAFGKNCNLGRARVENLLARGREGSIAGIGAL